MLNVSTALHESKNIIKLLDIKGVLFWYGTAEVSLTQVVAMLTR